MTRFFSLGAALLPLASLVSGLEFKPDDESSILSVTSNYAFGVMSYYKNNATNLPKEEIGVFPKPHYWWEAGAAWGGLIEYSMFTGDESHVDTLTQALVANYGPKNDIILPWRRDEEGNDDQAFWAFALMSALEYKFPDPKEDAAVTYLQVVENSFNNLVSRWDTESCNGGLKWQIYPDNANVGGYNYKNSISNGAVFALGARLAQYTGNQTYADWAAKIFDWSKAVGLVSDKYEVFDGTNDKTNCTDRDHTEWSYNVGVYLHGAAAMYNLTSDGTWKTHTAGLFDHASAFFKPYDNATNIMYEAACETGETGRHCNLDQQSFKAYLARFMAKTAILAPFTREKATTYLRTSAIAAAKSCSGPDDACGSKWYTGGWDGTSGVGQQLSALEVTQALLMLKKNIVPATKGDGGPPPTSTATDTSTAASSAPATSSQAAPTTSVELSGSSTSLATSITPTASPNLASGAPGPSSGSPVASATSSAVPSGVPGEFAPLDGTQCTCTPSSTVTIYVPPTATAVVPEPSAPMPPNGTVPVNPPANATTSAPAQFTGAATAFKADWYLPCALVIAACTFF
ncbi:hypothetical protein EJ04DRAFT_553369 [Polyplosphaeria fusca]|uniref:mannan endo-1,6-alpha-mannosidase n=1 Tax=Polyplosphaeria fusca TaxID=682080 RepID=A0A9P4QT84_9PLEO|nr:hypothetical protein EJ04DRAFT_553369 [Polyplosphaeria fusca]